MRTTLLGSLALLALGVCFVQLQLAATPVPPNREPSKPVAGLQLTLVRAEHGLVEITLHNVDKQPMVLNLGVMLGNGRQLIPVQLHLIVTNASGKTRKLALSYNVAGRVDDFLVPLMPAAKYTMTISLNDFFDAGANSKVSAGEKLHAVYQGAEPSHPNEAAIPFLLVWKHRVASNSVAYKE